MILGTVFSFGAMVQAYAASTTAPTAPTASVPVHTVSKAEVHQRIVIQAGDTLWAIAEANKHSNENVRSYIDKIKSLNHLATSSLNEGQVLLLP
ncbi:LysM peptidoglycan-binding domain-containing protein [Bacillus sp. 3255]|uniref:LysM peptidoglycan-binding domain-containing protein n=1 Tax=Bacillus sp. 3255 TaxID=2817904 RepID=UPI00286CD4B5|nr:LysM peptidoglycan-binding domain-containing protein [Bacillus sp. 3255]